MCSGDDNSNMYIYNKHKILNNNDIKTYLPYKVCKYPTSVTLVSVETRIRTV